MGKSLQPQNAIAVRQPVNTPAAAAPAAAASAPNEPVTAESLGWQLRAALPPLRLHSVSLYDEEANVLWLSEGALGPDEHNVVVEAIEALGSDTSLNCYESGLEDGRIAVFLPVRSPQGALVGLSMILADMKSVGDGVVERMMSPQVRTILQKVAVLLRPAPQRASSPTESLKILELAADAGDAPMQVQAPAPAKPVAPVSNISLAPSPARNSPATPAAPRPAPPALSPQAVDDILEFELTPDLPSPASHSQTQRLPALAAVNGSDLSLELTSEKPAFKAAPLPASAPKSVAPPVISASPAAKVIPVASVPVAKPVVPAPTPVAKPVAVAPAPVAKPVAVAPVSVTPVSVPIAAAPADVPSAADVERFEDSIDLRLPSMDDYADGPAPNIVIPTVGAAPASAMNGSAANGSAVNGSAVNGSGVNGSGINGSGVKGSEMHGSAANGSAMNGSGAPHAVPTISAAPVAPAAPATASASPSVSTGSTTTSRTLTGSTKALGATSTSPVLTMPEGNNLILEVQPFSKLRAGGRTRRYEVLARASHPNRVPSGFDKIALQQLLAWMGSHRSAWNLEPTSFTLNLSIATLEDERFPQFVASNLKANGIAPDNLGFEIAEPLCLQRRAQVERFITLCDKLGCFVVIDDFTLDSSITGLLRSKALRLVKIDPKLTSVAMKDKLAQAMVVAISQAVKVLGIHCAAKRVESQSAVQWLTAIGCDFAQGPALAQLQALETLGTPPPPVQPAT
jgi:EAL domain-containing protein (putative c-di-GMP-specific phosphodiesterase class I)